MSESQTIEYKCELSASFENEVIAFLNSKTGGHIYIGIDDDGSIYGVENSDLVQRQVTDRILNNIRPATLGLFDIVPEEREKKNIIHVIVSSGPEKPYYLKKFGMTPDGCFLRVGSSKRSMTDKMIMEQFSSRAKLSLGKIPSPRQDLTFAQLKIYYEELGKPLNNQFAKTLELLTPDGRYNYTAYLLADENGMSIKVARYSGTDKYELIESEEFGNCCLVKAVKSVLTRLQVANITRTKITPMERKETSLVDSIALREAVINAIAHNDYTREVPPLFEIFSDKIVITTYGGLVEGLSKEDFFNCCSMPRNRELMRVFHDLELVEQLGSGMTRIMHIYKSDIFTFTDNFIKTTFLFSDAQKLGNKLGVRLGNKLGNQSDDDEKQHRDRKNLSNVRRRILVLMEENDRISINATAQQLGYSSTAIERNVDYLKENGYLERIGNNRQGY